MKKLLIFSLTVSMAMLGCFSFMALLATPLFTISGFALYIGSMFIIVPCVWWWRDYFNSILYKNS
jgi:hypothetical protein